MDSPDARREQGVIREIRARTPDFEQHGRRLHPRVSTAIGESSVRQAR